MLPMLEDVGVQSTLMEWRAVYRDDAKARVLLKNRRDERGFFSEMTTAVKGNISSGKDDLRVRKRAPPSVLVGVFYFMI